VIERFNFKSGRESNRYASREEFRGVEEKSMQNTNAYVASEEREEIANEGKAGSTVGANSG